MVNKPGKSSKGPALRRQAEELLLATKGDVAAMPVENVQQLAHELQAHQIELEMQNDELRRSRLELEAARDRYADLYDFSPAGHLSLDTHGTIAEANLRAGVLLGVNRQELFGQPFSRFVSSDDQDVFYRHCQEIMKTGTRQTCEVRLWNKAGACCVSLESLAVHGESEDITHWRTALLDISDRKRMERELTNQRAQLEGIVTTAMDAIITVDEQSRVVIFNRAAESMFLCRAADAIGQPFDRFIPERFRQAHDDLAKTDSRSMERPNMQFGLRANGEEFPIEASGSHVRVDNKNLFTIIVRDVTERKQLQEEQYRLIQDLIRSRERFQTLFNLTPSAIAISTLAEGRFFDVNEGLSRLTGYSREELLGRTTLELGLWADPSERAIVLREIQEQGHLHNREGRLRTKSGEIRDLIVSVDPIRLGSTPCLIYLAHDITDRRQIEEELRGSEARLRAILDHSPGLVFLKDPEGRYLQINRQFEQTFHVTREQVLGKTDEDIFSPEQAAAFRANDLKVVQAGIALQFEEVAMQDDGLHTCIASKFPLYDANGNLYALCGMTTDITWRKTVEEILRSSDAFTRAILNSLSAQVCVLDREGVILKTNDAWRALVQRQADGLFTLGEIGDKYLDLCRHTTVGGTSTGQAILEGIEQVLMGSELSFIHEYGCHVTEEDHWFFIRVTPLKDGKGAVISHSDISRRVRMGMALEQHVRLVDEKQKELESLAGRLLEAQEQERKRIARELHDDFNQRLAALSLELGRMERLPLVLPKSVTKGLAAARDQVGQLSDDLHDLAYKLHPSLLEHVGLEIAMRDHLAEFAKRTGLPVRFTAHEVPGALSLEIATNLFRVMQESLQNVFKHAQATEVTVRLSGSSRGTGVSVRDNGKGFDFESKKAHAKGLGLMSMQERTRGLGGFLRVHSFSFPHGGTKICSWIPHIRKDT